MLVGAPEIRTKGVSKHWVKAKNRKHPAMNGWRTRFANQVIDFSARQNTIPTVAMAVAIEIK